MNLEEIYEVEQLTCLHKYKYTIIIDSATTLANQINKCVDVRSNVKGVS